MGLHLLWSIHAKPRAFALSVRFVCSGRNAEQCNIWFLLMLTPRTPTSAPGTHVSKSVYGGRQRSQVGHHSWPGRTGSSNRPWLSMQTGPIGSGVIIETLGYLPQVQPLSKGSLPHSTPSFPLLLFVTLPLTPFSPFSTLSLLTG